MANYSETELVTGRSGTPHISSNDIWQLHRGLIGVSGVCRLVDTYDSTYDCRVVINDTGNITIAKGSIIWNGMQIRNATNATITFDATINKTWYIVLHYTKVDEIESVRWELTDTEPAQSPTFAGLSDAYVTYYYFTFANGTSSNKTYNATILQGFGKLGNRIGHVNDVYTLWSNDSGLTPESGSNLATLSDSIRNYQFIGFIGDPMSDVKWYRASNIVLNTNMTVLLNKYGGSEYSLEKQAHHTVKFSANNNVECVQSYCLMLNYRTASMYSANIIEPYITKIIGVGKAV